MGDGDRTRDIRCHRPTLYQLSYAHQRINRGQFTLKPASIEMGGNLREAGPCLKLRTRWVLRTCHSSVRENTEIHVGAGVGFDLQMGGNLPKPRGGRIGNTTLNLIRRLDCWRYRGRITGLGVRARQFRLNKTTRLFALGIFFGGGMLSLGRFARAGLSRCPKSKSAEESAATAESTEDYNRKLERLREQFAETRERQTGDYRIGPQDLLDINIFEAPELNRTVRVSENGEVSLPLLGGIHVVRLTARELENTLAAKLREFLKDPHVSVMVTAIESHPVSVIGEVNKPGVFQVRGSKTLLEMLSMAQGLAPDAGDEVLVMRNAGYNRGQDGGAQAMQAEEERRAARMTDGIKNGTGSDDNAKDGALKKNATASIDGSNMMRATNRAAARRHDCDQFATPAEFARPAI